MHPGRIRPSITLPSDPSSRNPAHSDPMTTISEFSETNTLSTRFRSLDLVHRRAIHTLTGAVVTWLYLVVVWVAVPVSASLVIVWVGVPMMLATLAAVRGLAAIERRMAVSLLDVHIAPPPRISQLRDSRRGQLRTLFTNGTTWRGLGYLLERWIVGLVSFILATTFVSVAGMLAIAPFLKGAITIDQWTSRPGLSSAWAPAAAVLVAIGGWYLAAGIGYVQGFIAVALLGPSARDEMAVLQGRTAKLTAQTQLARELHDSVGHTMTSVVVQAGAAHRVFDSNPSFAKDALHEIGLSARQALDELDHMIGMLRNDGHATPDRSPAPTLADLPRLLSTAERSGLHLNSTLSGDPAIVPGRISRECFRIVQEGITNVTKHAPGTHARVTVEVADRSVTIEVANPVADAPSTSPRHSSGRGLVGITERANMLGGVAWSGPVEGSYILRVVIPYGAGPAAGTGWAGAGWGPST